MKNLFLLLTAMLIFSACGGKKGYETVQKTDANGFKYEEVTNDPFKARIYTLDNGLKVYLSQNKDEPRVQTIIGVRAGAKEDPRDNTGLAHYLEHMMFKGSTHFGTADWEKESVLIDSIVNLFEAHKLAQTAEEKKVIYKQIDAVSQEASKYAISNEYDKITGALGASGTNAFTSYDQTAYINEIPSNEIERFMKLEYDRFNNLVLRLFHTELETVYEEFNMYQDMGSQLIWAKAFEELFDKHPYKVDVIGLPQHLKSPSMKSVMAFQKNYYVPNNMVVCLTGDLEFEPTIQIVDKYFGQMKANPELNRPEKVTEEPLKGIKTREVFTPDQERVLVAYRSGGVKSKDATYLDMIGSILYNGKAGLVDLDLIQKQKVLNLFAGTQQLKDYGIFCFMASPREGQTLEDITVLIQEEITKLKKGEFDDALMEAIVNNEKLNMIQRTDGRGAAYEFLDAFVNEVEWKDYLSRIDQLAALTKEDVVAFANEFFGDDYVVVYKRTGENKEKVTVEKPIITPIKINRDTESDFAKELLAEKPNPIEPVFIDFAEKIKKEILKDGVDFYYTKNETNKIYELIRFTELGNKTDKKLGLAFQYLPYLGTSKYTPEQLKLEMYKLGMYFNASSSASRSYVSLYGLEETMDRSYKLAEEMMADAVVNKEAYDNMVADILKSRANNKINKSAILRGGLLNYAKYGEKSAFTDILSEEELKATDPQELIDIIKGFSSYKHGYHYYGPQAESKVAAMLKAEDRGELKDVPERVVYPELPMDKPTVYFAEYDMVQTEIMLLAKDTKFDASTLPYQNMFNSYYGGGMNSIVFQEIREARGLAYTAYAYVSNPARAEESNYIQAYVGTQPDKMKTAMDAFKDLLTNMASAEKQFALSKENVLNNMRTERLVKSNIFWNYMSLKDLGIDYDIRKPVFEAIQKMELADVQNYFDQHVKPAKYSVLIIGKKDKIDFNYLKQFGEIKELKLEEIFGY